MKVIDLYFITQVYICQLYLLITCQLPPKEDALGSQLSRVK